MSSIFLCCDLNVQVTGDVEGITGPHVHISPISSLESREFVFLQLLQNFDMFVCNTFHQCSDNLSCTRVPWSIFDEKIDDATQIDYVCASRNVSCTKVRMRPARVVKSDHIPIVCNFELPVAMTFTARSSRKSLAGFEFKTHEDEMSYIEGVFEALDLSGSSADLAKINEHSLIDISRVLNDTIREQSASTRSQRSRISAIKSPKLVDLATKIKKRDW